MKHKHKYILIAVSLALIWNLLAWIIAKQYYTARVTEEIEQDTKLSQERAADLADSIQRNLNYLHGIPDVFAEFPRVKNAVARFGPYAQPSSFPLETKKRRWTDDPGLNELSRYLALAKTSLNVDIIFLINAGGDCIAASNWDTTGSTIGTNFIDRDYYRDNKNGHRGMQYAVGKTTNIPGLYFSTPVFINGRFSGAVVAKTDVPTLSFLFKQLDAFITDENGVIVLAHDKNMEMLSLPGAGIASVPEQKRFARYRRSKFPILQIESWGDKEFPSLLRVQNEAVPHIFISRDIPEYVLKVYVGEELDDFHTLNMDALWFAFLLGVSGSVIILIAVGAFLYWNSIKTTQIALGRANMAERRIISISEDTQQRIGQELHDDLGQLLTGIAFMTEVLFKRLKDQGHAEAQDLAKITSMLNDAVSKTRHLAHGLFPVELKEAGLPAMLNNLAKNVAEIYHIDCDFIRENECNIDDQLVVINLFRIAQEAVNNAIKHSGATKIRLKLIAGPTDVTLEIADNGSGIGDIAKLDTTGGVGIHSMKYRASLLGGSLHIKTLPGGGTKITVNFSVERPSQTEGTAGH